MSDVTTSTGLLLPTWGDRLTLIASMLVCFGVLHLLLRIKR